MLNSSYSISVNRKLSIVISEGVRERSHLRLREGECPESSQRAEEERGSTMILKYLKLSSLLSPAPDLGDCAGLVGISKGNLPRGKDWIPLQ